MLSAPAPAPMPLLPCPPPEQSALYANYGYGGSQNFQLQQQQQCAHNVNALRDTYIFLFELAGTTTNNDMTDHDHNSSEAAHSAYRGLTWH